MADTTTNHFPNVPQNRPWDPAAYEYSKSKRTMTSIKLELAQVPKPVKNEEGVIIMPPQVMESAWKTWGNTVVGFFLTDRRPPGYDVVQSVLKQIWKLKGPITIRYFDCDDTYLLDVTCEEDHTFLLGVGAVYINKQVMVLKQWIPDIQTLKENTTTVPIWIRLFHVPFLLWHPRGLKFIAEKVGTPIKFDKITTEQKMAIFAGVCVEVSPCKKLPKNICINMSRDVDNPHVRVVDVVYSRVPLICTKCAVFGHEEGKCLAYGRDQEKGNVVVTRRMKKPVIEVSWASTEIGVFSIHADGSIDKNNKVGYGGVIRDCKGHVLFCYAGSLSDTKVVLDAELAGIEQGLDLAVSLNLKKVRVRSDSLQAINIVNGINKLETCPRHCWRSVEAIKEKQKEFDFCSFVHVYREANRLADCLSKLNYDDPECIVFCPPLDKSMDLIAFAREGGCSYSQGQRHMGARMCLGFPLTLILRSLVVTRGM